ncbi:DUF882 domain-containing protein [Polyangium mundeleinium]|uniref:Murein endopeptidase K n=1 Tax=Polyangium mundeleinium TaxID=2995306 RepID=A0ABT5F113_9BACT|nr:DUF882 domain-containing protein [Polyangium mundeleinium]MDC0747769.1 DUF882 domain-containing protein [Polyangium mundeleinium]
MDANASKPARSSFRLRCVALMAGAAVALLSVYAEAGDVVHVVAKGQVLVQIAKRYRTTVDAIRAANGLRPGQLLKPGQELVIPEKGKEAEAAKKAAAQRAAKESKKADAKESGAAGKGKKKGDPKPAKPEPLVMKPKRPGFVKLVRGSERLETQLLTKHGRLVPSALTGLGKMMRHGPSGSKTAIDPRLATLLGMVSDHFGGRTIHITSGFRPYSPTQYTKHSNHNLGRAIDFSIEGVPNTMLRDFCRTFRNAGVGYYPNSTFVHLDVRTTKAFWIDYSRPGEAPRYDSPVAQASADESTADVDQAPSGATPAPAGVGKETTPTPPAQGGGSGDTHPPPSQVVDPSTGNSSTQDPTPRNSPKAGQN